MNLVELCSTNVLVSGNVMWSTNSACSLLLEKSCFLLQQSWYWLYCVWVCWPTSLTLRLEGWEWQYNPCHHWMLHTLHWNCRQTQVSRHWLKYIATHSTCIYSVGTLRWPLTCAVFDRVCLAVELTVWTAEVGQTSRTLQSCIKWEWIYCMGKGRGYLDWPAWLSVWL